MEEEVWVGRGEEKDEDGEREERGERGKDFRMAERKKGRGKRREEMKSGREHTRVTGVSKISEPEGR